MLGLRIYFIIIKKTNVLISFTNLPATTKKFNTLDKSSNIKMKYDGIIK